MCVSLTLEIVRPYFNTDRMLRVLLMCTEHARQNGINVWQGTFIWPWSCSLSIAE